MPNYKGHLVGGAVIYALLFFCICAAQKPSSMMALEWFIATLAGALFPDIDIKSKGQKYFYYVVFVLFAALAARQRFEWVTCFSFIFLTPMLVKHRGIFHHPLFVIIMPLLLWLFLSTLVPKISHRLLVDTGFFIAGALSHIWLDVGTRQMMRGLLARKKKRW